MVLPGEMAILSTLAATRVSHDFFLRSQAESGKQITTLLYVHIMFNSHNTEYPTVYEKFTMLVQVIGKDIMMEFSYSN